MSRPLTIDMVRVLERVYFDADGEATGWYHSHDEGATWQKFEYPDKPPFILMPVNPGVEWVQQELWLPKNS